MRSGECLGDETLDVPLLQEAGFDQGQEPFHASAVREALGSKAQLPPDHCRPE